MKRTKGINPARLLQALFTALLAACTASSGLCREPSFDPADYDKIPPEYHDRVSTVVRFPTIYKKAPVPPFESSIRAYEFLLADLSLASKLARSAGISKYVVERQPEGLKVTDEAGIEGVLYPMYEEAGRRLYYAEGTCDARGLPKLTGKGVMEIAFHLTDDGKVENRVKIWVKLDSKVFGLLGKVLFPVVGRLVKGKTGALGSAAQTLSERFHSETEAMYETLEKSGLGTEEELARLKRFVEDSRAASRSPAPQLPGD